MKKSLSVIFMAILLVYSCDSDDNQELSVAKPSVIYDSGEEHIKPSAIMGLLTIPPKGQHFEGNYLVAPGDGKLEFSVRIYGTKGDFTVERSKGSKQDSTLLSKVNTNLYRGTLEVQKGDKFLFKVQKASEDCEINKLEIKFISE